MSNKHLRANTTGISRLGGDITGTPIAGQKHALDVAIKEGSVDSVPSGLMTAGKITEVTLNSATWTALPATALTDRNGLGLQNESAISIKVNYDSGVSGYVGWTIGPGGEYFIDLTDDVVIYAKSESGTPIVTINEVS